MEQLEREVRAWFGSERNALQMEIQSLSRDELVVSVQVDDFADEPATLSVSLDPLGMSTDSPELEDLEAEAVNFLFGGATRTVVEFLDFASNFIQKMDDFQQAGEDSFEGLTLHRAESLQIEEQQVASPQNQPPPKQGWQCSRCQTLNAMVDEECEKCPQKRPAEVLKTELRRARSYEVLTKAALAARQEQIISKAALELRVTGSAAAALLRHCRWDSKQLSNVWNMPAARDQLVEELGVANLLSQTFLPFNGDPDTEYTCEICYCDGPVRKTFALGCKHRFCIECWKGFLQSEIKSGATAGGNALESRCPGFKCKARVPEETYEMLLEPNDYAFYKKLLLHSYVDDNPDVVWCPKPGCGNVVLGSLRKRTVLCSCGQQFCFSCLTDAHAPTSCEEAGNWRGKDKGSQSLDAKFLLEQTKPCPKCGVRTKKEGGCMYIVCAQCKQPWCWQCGKSDHHVWECIRPSYGGTSGTAEGDMERYLFYYERYFNHQQSIKFSEDQRLRVIKKVKELMLSEDDMTESETDFLAQALELVIESRRVLSWTYAKIFTMEKDGPARDLFEFQQAELEKWTEKLNKLVEDKENKLTEPAQRKQVMECTAALNKYLTNIEGGIGVSSVKSSAQNDKRRVLSTSPQPGPAKPAGKVGKKRKPR